MKKIILAAAAVAAVAAPVALSVAPANAVAGSPGCVTRAEWNSVRVGMSRAQVYRVTGTWGRFDSILDFGDGTWAKYYDYRQCWGNGLPAHSWNLISMNYSNFDINMHIHQPTLDDKGWWATPV